MKSTWQKGRILENEVEKIYQNAGYLTWKPQKMKFASQDVLEIADIVATCPEEFVLVAVSTRDAQRKTLDKIFRVLPHLPESIIVRYYISRQLKSGRKLEVREWKGQA